MLEFIKAKGQGLSLGQTYKNAKNNSVVLQYTEVSEAQYENYCKSFLPEFTVYDEKCVVGNRFATLVTDTHELHLCFYPAIAEMRVIYGGRTWLPPKSAPKVTNDMPTSFTQIGLVIGGMLYVAQLSDGSFLLIDSGKKNDEDRDLLLNFLYEKKPAHHEKPKIAAWLISHAHHDHLHLCLDFLLTYGDKVELSLFGYNFPDFENGIIESDKAVETEHAVMWQARMKAFLDERHPDVTRYTMHTGQTLRLPGCNVDFLGTWEDYWPETMVTVNQTSFILRLCFEGGCTFLLPADAWTGQTDLAVKVWGEYLKSDVLQVVHHGLAGGNVALYEKVMPKIVFWPTSEARFSAPEKIPDPKTGKLIAVVRGYKPSLWLLDKVARHYHTGRNVTVDSKTLEEI